MIVKDAQQTSRRKTRLSDIPGGIWALGFVSLLMDVSSEMIHALLPVYLVSVFGVSMATVGLIEGAAEATASIVKIFSGALSDWLGKRKLLAVIGYGVAAATKPIFPLASGVGWLVAARLIDRVGKGVRGAPRDALVADISPPHLRGASFGLRQSLDTIGAFLGPMLAIALMQASGDDFKLVFWVATIPAILCVLVLLAAVREPAPSKPRGAARFPLRAAELAGLGRAYWLVTLVAAVFALARFSEAFLILRARDAGLPIALAPLVLVAMNLVYAPCAYPVGVLSDRLGRLPPLYIGLLLLIGADIALAAPASLATVALGVALWGLHMGFTQGLLATLVADSAPAALRGTAFGVFNLVGGVATLAASLIAGALWDHFGAAVAFGAGAGFAALALIGLALAHRAAPQIGAGHA